MNFYDLLTDRGIEVRKMSIRVSPVVPFRLFELSMCCQVRYTLKKFTCYWPNKCFKTALNNTLICYLTL